jgi:hypothetical protein
MYGTADGKEITKSFIQKTILFAIIHEVKATKAKI